MSLIAVLLGALGAIVSVYRSRWCFLIWLLPNAYWMWYNWPGIQSWVYVIMSLTGVAGWIMWDVDARARARELEIVRRERYVVTNALTLSQDTVTELLKRIRELEADAKRTLHRLEAIIDRQAEQLHRLQGTNDHPENHCHICGGKNISWYVDNDLWNLVVPSDMKPKSHIFCPLCFVQLAEKVGIHPTAWRLSREGDDPEVDELRIERNRQAEQIQAYTHLNETVAISCSPPSDCNDPVVLKKYMKACLDAVVTDEQCGKD